MTWTQLAAWVLGSLVVYLLASLWALRPQAMIAALLVGAAASACGRAGPTQPPASIATNLSFTVQPNSAAAGAGIAPAVAIQDASGNIVPSATSAVTVAIGANPGGGTLSGTTTVNPVNGVASFPGLSINKAGSGYTLVASSGTLTSGTSAAFTIAPGPVASVWVNPGAAILTFPGGPTNVQLQATPLDANGNSVATAVMWSTSDPTVATVDATGLVSDVGVGTTTISASAGGRAGTAAIGVACGPPRCTLLGISFSQQPTTARAGATISPPVQASISTAFLGSCWSGVVSIAIGTNPGGATLTGNTDVQVSYYNYTATWSSLTIDKPGSGYTLVAIVKSTSCDNNVGGGTSNAFNITP